MMCTNALGTVEVQISSTKTMIKNAIVSLLEKEHQAFSYMMSRSLRSHSAKEFRVLGNYLEQKIGTFHSIFSRLNEQLDDHAVTTQLTIEAGQNSQESELQYVLKILRMGQEIQTQVKQNIAIDALYVDAPILEELMVSIVEFHEEMCAIIERFLAEV